MLKELPHGLIGDTTKEYRIIFVDSAKRNRFFDRCDQHPADGARRYRVEPDRYCDRYDRLAVRRPGGPSLVGAAKKSELLSREITHCLAPAGETEEALDWLENTVQIGNINYPFWAQYNEWVDSIRVNSRFDAIMRNVEREWLSVTFDG